MPFSFQPLEIPDLVLIKAKKFNDDRGFFMETYKRSDFAGHGITGDFCQTNHSRSAQGVVRGMHYQIRPRAQGKLLMVPHGRIFDVAVDIRRGSPTFGQWAGHELSAENGCMLYVPAGFAHGFCVLSPVADLIYMVTAEYSGQHERGIRWDDPEIGIDWPVDQPLLSTRDEALPLLRDAEYNFEA